MPCKRILITPGEPAGIGPELVVRIAQQKQNYELAAVCDPTLLTQTAKCLSLPLSVQCLSDVELVSKSTARKRSAASEISCVPIELGSPVNAGILDQKNAGYVLNSLRKANELCLQRRADAIVTGPVQKSIINDAGIAFSGHTEFFAEQTHTEKVVMMLATEGLRVALATTHLPLKDVAAAITKTELTQVMTILHAELKQKFAIPEPRILVCGLNPHAGEGGHLGSEEINIISPVLEIFRSNGINVVGPLPADTLFTPHYLDNADAVLAMYHDQGLPTLKFKGFGNAVNITLGLPYIRTSVDHGTALDLAGKGLADLGSLEVALREAENMSELSSH